jgi:hypothetical protein
LPTNFIRIIPRRHEQHVPTLPVDGKAGHDVFTAVLLDGLKGKADLELRGNKDNRVDVVELSEYAKRYVTEEAKKIDLTHTQKATGFFMGSDFFELVEVKS